MTTATSHRGGVGSSRPQSTGVLSSIVGAFFEVMMWLILSLLLSIIMEWIGITFWWKDQGAVHSLDLYRAEIKNLAVGLQPIFGGFVPAETASSAINQFYTKVWQDSGILGWIANGGDTVRQYGLATVNITLLFLTRVFILTMATPVFLLFGIVGLTDGLVERDVRRWSGGRESGYVFHFATKFLKPAIIWAWMIYLAAPIAINPAFVVVPFAVLFAISLRVSAATFKKYL